MDGPPTRNDSTDGERSRDGFFSDAALAGVGVAGLSVLGSGAVAANDDSASEPSDIDVLNYALTLEHLEAAFYNEFLDEYSEREVEQSEVAGYFARATLQYSVYQQIQDVRDHEEAHVEALKTTITDLGGTPVEPADYEFPYSSIDEFVALADRIEAVGVSAYAGAAPLLDNPDLIPPALSIHSVEADHQTYFQLLHLQRPAPNAFNPARSMDQVLPIARQFIVGADGDDSGEGQLSVAELSADSDSDDLNEEFLTYENTGDGPLDLSGWTVEDSSGTTYTFPDRFTLAPDAQVTLYTGSGTDTDTELYWNQSSEVWDDGADTMTVRNADGETVLERSYP